MPPSIAARRIACCVICFFSLGAQPARAIADEPAEASRVTIEQDSETLATTLLIAAKDGKVSWADLWAGLTKAKGFDDDALADLSRRKSFDLNRRHTRVLLALMNAVGESSGVQFAIVPPDAPNLLSKNNPPPRRLRRVTRCRAVSCGDATTQRSWPTQARVLVSLTC